MKTRAYILFATVAAATATVLGQTAGNATPTALRLPAGPALDAPLPPLPPGVATTAERIQVGLDLKWDAREQRFTVEVENPTDKAIPVLGVQTTPAVYVTAFPASIPAKGKAVVSLLYVSPQIERGTEVIRVRTALGEHMVVVTRNREKVVSSDQAMLNWKVGEEPVTKVALISVDSSKATGLKATGAMSMNGHRVMLKPVGDDKYAVEVTPASTESAARIPVILRFEPALPASGSVVDAFVGMLPQPPPAITRASREGAGQK